MFITSSRLLLQYESMTKKAAKFSAEAGRQLRKTRTTQGSAVVASVISTLSAAYLLASANSTQSSSGLSLVNAIVCSAAAGYVGGFWKGAMKAPFGLGGSEYNDAIRATERGLSWLYRLGMGWAITFVGCTILGFLSK